VLHTLLSWAVSPIACQPVGYARYKVQGKGASESSKINIPTSDEFALKVLPDGSSQRDGTPTFPHRHTRDAFSGTVVEYSFDMTFHEIEDSHSHVTSIPVRTALVNMLLPTIRSHGGR
jgi:hypothetical protein